MKPWRARHSSQRRLKETTLDLFVHKVELEAQNLALREARQEREVILERYADLFESAPVGFARFDSRGLVEELNLAGCAMLGVTKDAVLGKPFVHLVVDSDRKFFLDHLHACLREEEKLTCEVRLKVERTPGLSVRLITQLKGSQFERNVTYRVVLLDLTDERKVALANETKVAEEARRIEAELANSAKSTFLANVSHEMRTPLTSILGFGQMLLANGNLAAPEARHVATIVRNSQQLLHIMNDLLDLAKIEAGKFEIEKLEFSVHELFEDVYASFSPEADKKCVLLSVRTEGLVPLRITSDPTRLRQVINNVVGNAVKFTSQGKVEIVLRSRCAVHAPAPGVAPRRMLHVTVSDTGPGLSSEQRENLFKPFNQGDVSVTRIYGGSGLGLVLGRQLARALGGDLELISSQPGRGSVFEFTIDALAPKWCATARTGGSESPVRAGHHRHKRLLTGVRILVVEDSRDIQELVSLVLTREGAEVHLASDGDEGVRMAMAGQYDVVLMDIELPLTDGRAATRMLRTRGYARPIVALTAGAMTSHGDRGLGSGFDGYVTKPVDKDELTRVVLSFEENRPGQMH